MKKKNGLKLFAVGILVLIGVLLQKIPTEATSLPDSNVFDISEGNITIAATGSAIQVSYGASQSKVMAASDEITITGTTTSNCVVVNGVTAHITLKTVVINLYTINDACAFALTNGAEVILTLQAGTISNFKSGANMAGISVSSGQKLTILGTGELSASAGNNAAGIGGSKSSDSLIYNGGTIEIQNGVIYAYGYTGIGGGDYGSGGNITITGGTVTAKADGNGAGIGGGYSGGGGNISILGGTVTAVGALLGAGIGDGCYGTGTNNIRIENATVTAISRYYGAGIGGANMSGGVDGTTGDTITIAATAVIKAVSDGTKPAIYAPSNALTDESTASILLITSTAVQSANTNISIYDKATYVLNTSFNPVYNFQSFALSVPVGNTYELTVNGVQQKNSVGIDYSAGAAGIYQFSCENTVDTDITKACEDKEALTDSIIKGSNTDLSHVSEALAALPSVGSVNASVITWNSSSPSILSYDGQTVVRPAYGTGATSVTLTATITNGTITVTKAFTIMIVETPNPDIAKVAADYAAITSSAIKGSNTDLSHVTGALAVLPSVGAVNASTITWISTKPSVLSNDGQTVIRPAYGTADVSLQLIATITKGTETQIRTFLLKVKALDNSDSSNGGSDTGTNSTSTYVPTVTPLPTSSINISMNAEHNISIIINCTEEDINSSDNYILPIPLDKVKELIADEKVNDVVVSVILPEYEQEEEIKAFEGNLVLENKITKLMKESDKTLIIKVIDDTNKERYRWAFAKNNLEGAQDDLGNINLSLHVSSLADNKKLNETLKQENIKGFLISFDQNSILSTQATVRIYVGDIKGIKPGSKVYVYHNNQVTGKLEYLPHSSNYSVSKDGYITISVIDASDYVILNSKAPSNLTKSLLSQVEVTLNNSILYLGKSKKNTIQFNIIMPATMKLVEKLNENGNSSNAIGELTIIYSSSNNKVATVDKRGTITAVGKGKVLVTAKITLYSGETKVVKKYITVK